MQHNEQVYATCSTKLQNATHVKTGQCIAAQNKTEQNITEHIIIEQNETQLKKRQNMQPISTEHMGTYDNRGLWNRADQNRTDQSIIERGSTV